MKQSERFPLYDAAVEKLKASGRLYPAYETQDELELKRKRQLARGRPPVYDRAALKLTDADRAKLEAEGHKPHWRFQLETRDVVWDDLVRGEQHVDAASLSDPVLVRADGSYLYTLPSVVDDIDLGVTHVVRGEDHVANTAPQIQLFEALGAAPPAFGHHSLLVGAGGQALSKRDRSLAIEGMRQDGLEPLAVASYAAPIGTSDPVVPHLALDELVQGFAFGKLSRAPARFDVEELRGLNAKLLHALPYEAVAPRLDRDGGWWRRGHSGSRCAPISPCSPTSRTGGAWSTGPLEPVIADAPLCGAAAALLPPEPWDACDLGAMERRGEAGDGDQGQGAVPAACGSR